MSKHKELFFLTLIIVTNFFLRLWRLAELFQFTYDESVFAFIGKQMITKGHIPLIGGVTPFHVHLAPYFYWFSAIGLFFSKLNPVGWGLIAAIISNITVLLFYTLVKKIHSRKLAFLSVLIYCFSVYINVFDRHFWGLMFNPLLSVLVLYSLIQISQQKNKYYLLLSGAVSFGFHTDPSTLVFLSLIILFLLKNRLSIKRNKFAYFSLAIFLLSFFPLLIFDVRHNLVNIKGFLQYVPEVKTTTGLTFERIFNSILFIPVMMGRVIYLSGSIDLAKEYSYCQKYVDTKITDTPFVLLLFSFLAFLFLFIRKDKQTNKQFIFLLKAFVLCCFISILVYKGLLGRLFYEHYFTLLLPTLVVIVALIVTRLAGKRLLLLLTGIFVLLNIYKLTQVKHSYGFQVKSDAVKWAINNTDKEFALDSLSDCFRYNGYRYLFYLYGKEPVKSYVDQNFFWLYDKLPAENHPPLSVVIVSKDYRDKIEYEKRYQNYQKNLLKSKKFGDIEVLIVDNKKGIFYEF